MLTDLIIIMTINIKKLYFFLLKKVNFNKRGWCGVPLGTHAIRGYPPIIMTTYYLIYNNTFSWRF